MNQSGFSGRSAAVIAASVERSLHEGRLAPGSRLPTVRALAQELEVSPVTVSAAYRLLAVRGLVSGHRRRGTQVASRPPSPAAPLVQPIPEGVVDLAGGNPDPALLPPLEPALRAIDPGQVLYGAESTLPDLAAFAVGEFEQDGIATSGVAVLSGALDAIERTLREHLKPGDRVAVEDPSFPGIAALVMASGWIPLPVEVDAEGPVPGPLATALRAGCRALVISPRAQNPTGAALTPQRVADLQELLRDRADLLLIENDHAGPVAGVPAMTLCGPGLERWAIVRSTSKYLGPDLRVALMAADALTLNRVRGRQALGARWVSHILQRLVVALWSDPSNGRRVARAADTYAQRRRALTDALGTRGIAAHGRSGLNVWIPVGDETHTVRELAERGWAVAPGERFRIKTGPGIRVTVAGLPASDAARFAEDLASVSRHAPAGFA